VEFVILRECNVRVTVWNLRHCMTTRECNVILYKSLRCSVEHSGIVLLPAVSILSKYHDCYAVGISNTHGEIVGLKNCVVQKYISNRNKRYVTSAVNTSHTTICMYRSDW